ncbi:flagellar biosynthetic protein FliR [Neobacillus jeddahensis]|uniref:flagellar biosynthetic protein FliR n=1 Tax=Neobacillus jeddahensis TaxID=1461580 RepID=UPI00058B616B|nr:flagellar biosynthetic protein FliR [Neobacillus jeddahensis]
MDISFWLSALLIFVRISSFMVSAPLFSGRQIPNQYKVGLSVALSFLCAGVVDEPIESLSQWMLMVLILKEFLVGIVLGLVASILFYSVQMAGALIDLQIGFAMATMFDPTFQTSTQLTGRFKNILAILVLLSINGHHLLIQGVLASFDWISLQSLIPDWTDGRLSSFVLESVKQMFMIGFLMAAPITGTMFIVDIAIGILSRTVPQLNILSIAPPLKIMLYFVLYMFLLPSFIYLLNILFETMFGSMSSIMKIMGA